MHVRAHKCLKGLLSMTDGMHMLKNKHWVKKAFEIVYKPQRQLPKLFHWHSTLVCALWLDEWDARPHSSVTRH
jgi:hypothetical protein